MLTEKVDADIWLRSTFPNLNHEHYELKSPDTDAYNCIAWAAHDTERWWEPSGDDDHYWPPELPFIYTFENYVCAFEIQGYETCDSDRFELGYEKVALYVDTDGTPQHMARQLPSGLWTSKVGRAWDIEHQTVHAVEGNIYGTVVRYMKRVI
jgi:hypothetical protein